ncbi:MAG TPA: invasion associated locus B family protein [Xanthobacteraceae bacterium]|nr:invasion associated locus B family protein [Xanthobacteraceae bacterium]
MKTPNAPAPARPVGRTLAAIGRTIGQGVILTAALAMATADIARAQQPLAPPPAAPAARPKPAPAKPRPPAAAKPGAPASEAQQTAPPAAQGQAQAQGEQQQPQLIYSPWTKFCLKSDQNDPNSKQVCFTGKDARIESGMPIAAVVVIEQQGEPKKLLQVTLPLHLLIQPGTRVIVDQDQPLTAPYYLCVEIGCLARYEATPELIAKMKKGQVLNVQAINQNNQPITVPLPLAEFAKAYDGPPTDPKVFEAQQQKLQEELQRRADEARKELEQKQGGAPQSSNAPPRQ